MKRNLCACVAPFPLALLLLASAASAQSPAGLHDLVTPVFERPEAEQPASLLPRGPGKPPGLAPSSVVGGSWTWLGPAPTVGAQLTVPPNNKVAGCIQAIAAHPTNPDILYIGAVNGGVWRTMNATAADPTWTPLTDMLPSLAIGALEFDPTDASRQTLIAGSARLSSFAARGGLRIGVLYSTNGGNSWSVFGTTQFANENLTSVAARSNVLLVGSDSISGGNGSGLFRSTDTGGSFQLVSGVGGTGLPAGPISDLVGDPGNSSRFYAAVRTAGIFRSDNTGTTWTDVTGGITGISASTTKIEMAVHNNGANNVIYAGVLTNRVLASVWRSPNLGVSWTQMDTPAVNNGAQGNLHFSIVADPVNPAIVYVGGDSGINLYRGNASLAPGSQFTSIVGANAGNTTPHVDSREMVFDANGNIIEGDDGGLYRRSSPQSSAGTWTSVVGDLGVIEAHSVAYDSVTHTAMIGTQDNGTHIMTSTNSLVWTWISGGDGGDVAIDDRTLAGKSIRYGSFQNFAGFYRRTYDASNNLLTNSTPTLTLLAGSPAISGQFVTPVEINKVDPARLAIGGGNSVYESMDRGDSATALSVGFAVNRVALAYGGWLAGVPNPDVLYYGSGTTVRLRTTSGGAITATAGTFPGGTVRDVVLNTNDWRQVFAVDISDVYASTNSGTNWINITGNLVDVGELRTLEFFRFGASDCVAVGTDVGVFVSFLNNLGVWSQLGTGLPHTSAFELVCNPQDNVLVIGTLGRGVFRFSTLSEPALATNTAVLLAESCPVGNLAIDPGELVTVGFSLRNVGGGNTANLVATLAPSGNIISPSGPQTYGVMVAGGAAVTNNYSFTANGPCGGAFQAVLQLQDGTNNLGTVTFVLPFATNCCYNPTSVDLRLTTTDAPDPVAAGSDITYTILVTNRGPATATSVTATNTLPAGVAFVSATPSQGSASHSAGVVTASLGSLAPNASASLVIVATATAAGNFTNRSTVAAAQSDYDLGNNSDATVTTALVPSLSFSNAFVQGGNGNGVVDVNECNRLYLIVRNTGTVPAFNVVGTLTTATPGVFLSEPVVAFPNVPAGGSSTNLVPYNLNTLPDFACGTNISFTLALGFTVGSNTLGFMLPSSGISTRFDQGSPLNIPDLTTVESSNTVSGFSGPIAKVTVSLHLNHTFDGDLLLSLISPDNTVVELSQRRGGGFDNFGSACAPDTARTTFDDAATTAIFSGDAPFTGTFRPDQGLTNFNSKSGAAVNGVWRLRLADRAGSDFGVLNCWSLFLTGVGGCLDGGGICLSTNDVGLTMTDFPDPVRVGQSLTYSLTATNTGPAAATGVIVSNTLPAGVAFVSAVSSQGGCAIFGGVVVCTLGTMPGASGASMTIVGVPGAPGVLTNRASISRGEPDSVPSNNTATAVTVANYPALSISSASLTEGNTGATGAVFTVSLFPAFGQTVTVQFTTSNQTALAGSDYAATNGTLTFTAGQTNQSVIVRVNGDLLNEANETFTLHLSNAVNAVLANGVGAGTILNDDALPSLSISDASVAEGNAGATGAVFTVSLSAFSGQTVTVFYSTANGTATAGSDYTAISSTLLTFNPGETNKLLTVSVNGDGTVESNETFFVNLSGAGNALIADSQGLGTILDDDGLPGVLHHFGWGFISSPQVTNGPIPVRLTALDIFGNVASNFTGVANLAAQRESFHADFEFGLQGFTFSNNFGFGGGLWHLSTGRGSQSGHSPTHSLYYGTNETVSGGGNYDTGRNEGLALSPVLDLRGAAAPITLAFNYVIQSESGTSWDHATVEVLTNSSTNFVIVSGNNIGPAQFGTASGGWASTTASLSAFAGMQIQLRLHFNTLDASANNFEGWYLDDLVVASGLSILPSVTASFVDGVWVGAITAFQPGPSVVLRADDGAGHTGSSLPFALEGAPRLAIARPNNFVVVSWPASASGFGLERANLLLSSNNLWVSVTNAPLLQSDRYVLTNLVPASNAVFRLRKP